MKKLALIFVIIIVVILGISSYIYAEPAQNSIKQTATNNQIGEIEKMKNSTGDELKEYEELYGSKAYGYTAFILNKIRLYSIPLCFVGIAVGSIYQYVIGIRRLDLKDRGFNLIIAFVTILVICQVLPLIFAIVVQGWRG